MKIQNLEFDVEKESQELHPVILALDELKSQSEIVQSQGNSVKEYLERLDFILNLHFLDQVPLDETYDAMNSICEEYGVFYSYNN